MAQAIRRLLPWVNNVEVDAEGSPPGYVLPSTFPSPVTYDSIFYLEPSSATPSFQPKPYFESLEIQDSDSLHDLEHMLLKEGNLNHGVSLRYAKRIFACPSSGNLQETHASLRKILAECADFLEEFIYSPPIDSSPVNAAALFEYFADPLDLSQFKN
ncbi:hypothetical protein CPB83DRAFT_896048 [Crepidotus variabilis]|uniref:Uncharacterized protein n=1 Tax=Crepidotus variabilis TaxID=179855 RepID=A0A9P6ECZ6_9AGAR|nr:hypothetical protein CPB83DRAFT_896048 [Crepidotus variabilis]